MALLLCCLSPPSAHLTLSALVRTHWAPVLRFSSLCTSWALPRILTHLLTAPPFYHGMPVAVPTLLVLPMLLTRPCWACTPPARPFSTVAPLASQARPQVGMVSGLQALLGVPLSTSKPLSTSTP